MTLAEQVKAARRVSTPIVAINTPDPAATIQELSAAINGSAPKLEWDIVRSFQPINAEGREAIGYVDVDNARYNPSAAFVEAAKLPAGSVLFIHNAQSFLGDAPAKQALWNLRDLFKADKRMVVLLGQGIVLPPELAGDVLTFDEPLPDGELIGRIIDDVSQFAGVTVPPESRSKAVEALTGLPAFQVEQVAAMSLTSEGIDVDSLWERKRRQIEQTPGLTVDRHAESFEDIGGLSQAKEFGKRLFAGPCRPAVVCRIEEIEKVMAGSSGDTSGVSQDALQVILNSMQDYDWTGIIAFGPPGSGKSLYSKALAATFGAFSLGLDMGAAKGSLVGESEQKIRACIKTIHAIGGKRVFFVATANKLDSVPAELRRRFRYGVWMFDSPDAEERRTIWRIWQTRFKLDPDDRLENDDGLTGSDIRNICELSMGLQCSLSEAATFTAPVAKSSPQAFEEARKLADGRFLSASCPGLYARDVKPRAKRAIDSR